MLEETKQTIIKPISSDTLSVKLPTELDAILTSTSADNVERHIRDFIEEHKYNIISKADDNPSKTGPKGLKIVARTVTEDGREIPSELNVININEGNLPLVYNINRLVETESLLSKYVPHVLKKEVTEPLIIRVEPTDPENIMDSVNHYSIKSYSMETSELKSETIPIPTGQQITNQLARYLEGYNGIIEFIDKKSLQDNIKLQSVEADKLPLLVDVPEEAILTTNDLKKLVNAHNNRIYGNKSQDLEQSKVHSVIVSNTDDGYVQIQLNDPNGIIEKKMKMQDNWWGQDVKQKVDNLAAKADGNIKASIDESTLNLYLRAGNITLEIEGGLYDQNTLNYITGKFGIRYKDNEEAGITINKDAREYSERIHAAFVNTRQAKKL